MISVKGYLDPKWEKRRVWGSPNSISSMMIKTGKAMVLGF